MKTPIILTIGRQFGSGGREIGERIARELDLAFYDKQLLEIAAEESDIAKELFETHDERPTSSLLYTLAMDLYAMRYPTSIQADMPLNHKIFLAQFHAIQKIGKKGNCVLVGRCSDYALADQKNAVHVFIRADLDDRVRRVADTMDISRGKARELIMKEDKKRASYYNYFTSNKWGMAEHYHCCLDSSLLGIEGTVHVLKEMLEWKRSRQSRKSGI